MSDLWAKAIQQTTNALSANDILPNEKLNEIYFVFMHQCLG